MWPLRLRSDTTTTWSPRSAKALGACRPLLRKDCTALPRRFRGCNIAFNFGSNFPSRLLSLAWGDRGDTNCRGSLGARFGGGRSTRLNTMRVHMSCRRFGLFLPGVLGQLREILLAHIAANLRLFQKVHGLFKALGPQLEAGMELNETFRGLLQIPEESVDVHLQAPVAFHSTALLADVCALHRRLAHHRAEVAEAIVLPLETQLRRPFLRLRMPLLATLQDFHELKKPRQSFGVVEECIAICDGLVQVLELSAHVRPQLLHPLFQLRTIALHLDDLQENLGEIAALTFLNLDDAHLQRHVTDLGLQGGFYVGLLSRHGVDLRHELVDRLLRLGANL
mmetsp:Transcript_105706/g.303970  ORF Transcript_105706/g.303970 Transcript_105706/m.303970 type:complete len:337 (-) Transcript_105706:273-1283(-)